MKNTLFFFNTLKILSNSVQITTLGLMFIVVSIILKGAILSTKNLTTTKVGVII